MAPNQIADPDDDGCDHQGDPSPFEKLLGHRDDKDGKAEGKAGHVNGQMLLPHRFGFTMGNEKSGHSQFGQRKGRKDIDGVHHDEGGDVSMSVEKKEQRCPSHQEDPVVHRQAFRKVRESVRKPRVDGHIRHDPGTIDKTGLSGHKQERSLGKDRHQREPMAKRPPAEEISCEDSIESLTLNGANLEEEVADENPSCGEGQGGRHVKHRSFARLNLGVPHDLKPIGHRLNARISPSPKRIRMNEKKEESQASQTRNAAPADFPEIRGRSVRRLRGD